MSKNTPDATAQFIGKTYGLDERGIDRLEEAIQTYCDEHTGSEQKSCEFILDFYEREHVLPPGMPLLANMTSDEYEARVP